MHGVVHGVEDGVVVSVEDKKYLYHLRPSDKNKHLRWFLCNNLNIIKIIRGERKLYENRRNYTRIEEIIRNGKKLYEMGKNN